MDLTNILDFLQLQLKLKSKVIIGICGIPGSGKSTFSVQLSNSLPDSIVIPFDGYHKYRKELNEDQIKYRGRFDTFNLDKFKSDFLEFIAALNNEEPDEILFSFPSFDHSLKDPFEKQIKISNKNKIFIFEGIYLFSDEFRNIQRFFDIRVFLESNLDKALDRVALRHFNSGIEKTLEASKERAFDNDRRNAEFILKDSNLDGAIILKFLQ